MKYRRPIEWRCGRVQTVLNVHSLNLPYPFIYADGETVNVGINYGNGNSDPVLCIDVDLSRTHLGAFVSWLYWRIQDWLDARRPTRLVPPSQHQPTEGARA